MIRDCVLGEVTLRGHGSWLKERIYYKRQVEDASWCRVALELESSWRPYQLKKVCASLHNLMIRLSVLSHEALQHFCSWLFHFVWISPDRSWWIQGQERKLRLLGCPGRSWEWLRQGLCAVLPICSHLCFEAARLESQSIYSYSFQHLL